MSGMLEHREFEQPAHFEFTPEYLAAAQRVIARYPAGRQASAVIPLLDMAQRQAGGWLPKAAMDYVAGLLGMPNIRVYEVASFYTMFYRQPVGKYVVQICRTTPCWLRGSDDVTKACYDKLGIKVGQTTPDEQFTLLEVECLGACVNAPVVQINDDYFEDLDYASMSHVIDALKAGKPMSIGSQTGRLGSAPDGGPQVLKQIEPIGPGSVTPTKEGKTASRGAGKTAKPSAKSPKPKSTKAANA